MNTIKKHTTNPSAAAVVGQGTARASAASRTSRLASGVPIRYAVGPAPAQPGSEVTLGCALIARSERGICAILLGDEQALLEAELARYFPGADLQEDRGSLSDVLADWWAFLATPSRGFLHPLDLAGTPLQQQVWQALQAIPVGSTLTYTDLAVRVGRPQAVRAVASACAANRLAVVIPCHRVVGRSGSLTGYRWGLDRKRLLLDMEAAQ